MHNKPNSGQLSGLICLILIIRLPLIILTFEIHLYLADIFNCGLFSCTMVTPTDPFGLLASQSFEDGDGRLSFSKYNKELMLTTD
jgi:hypothetical protein